MIEIMQSHDAVSMKFTSFPSSLNVTFKKKNFKKKGGKRGGGEKEKKGGAMF